MAKKEQKRGTCIFCGGRPLSKEHVWPAWLQKHITEASPYSNHTVTLNQKRQIQLGKLNRPGSPRSQRLRVVCLPCNNGWMSRLQNRAKPVVLKMLHDGTVPTMPSDREALARWCAMFSFVYETAAPELSTSTPEERTAFSESEIPPRELYVYAAPAHVPIDSFLVWRRPGTLHLPEGGEEIVQVTAMNLERLVLFISSFPIWAAAPQEVRNVHEMWPDLSPLVAMPPTMDMLDVQRFMYSVMPAGDWDHEVMNAKTKNAAS